MAHWPFISPMNFNLSWRWSRHCPRLIHRQSHCRMVGVYWTCNCISSQRTCPRPQPTTPSTENTWFLKQKFVSLWLSVRRKWMNAGVWTFPFHSLNAVEWSVRQRFQSPQLLLGTFRLLLALDGFYQQAVAICEVPTNLAINSMSSVAKSACSNVEMDMAVSGAERLLVEYWKWV